MFHQTLYKNDNWLKILTRSFFLYLLSLQDFAGQKKAERMFQMIILSFAVSILY